MDAQEFTPMAIPSTGPSREERGTSASKSAYSIAEFCRDHSISRSLYYKLKKLGLAPREIEVMNRKLITHEAAADWRA
jgi:hypothetical protein